MVKYVVRRLLVGIPVMFAIILVTFGLSHAMPGGPFDVSNQRRLPPHISAQLEQKFGLQNPVFFNLPNDGKGADTAWGKTVSVKGHQDTGYETKEFDAPEGAGIQLYGEYNLIDNGQEACNLKTVQPGWALISHREECVVVGGDVSQTFTEVRSSWGSDLLEAQFWNYLTNVARLDFGPSLNLALVQENKQVTDIIRERVPVSLQLGIFSTLVGFAIGIPLGVMAAVYHNSLIDYMAMFFAVLGQSIPAIVLAPVLILFFAVKLRVLPVADPLIWKDGTVIIFPYVRSIFFLIILLGATWQLFSVARDKYREPTEKLADGAVALGIAVCMLWLLSRDRAFVVTEFPTLRNMFVDYVKALVLPVITIGTGMSAGIARLTRASLLQVLHDDYIQTARSKGLPERTVLYIHALKNALIPVVTAVGPLLAGIVTGSFIIELVFSIPGMGETFITAVGARDYTTIMGVTIFYSSLLILGNILVDIMYTWLDPRIRYD